MALLSDLARERAEQMEHARLRLRERFGLLAGERTVEELARTALEQGERITGWDLRKIDGARSNPRRQTWVRVTFRGRDMAVCVDFLTAMVRTVVPFAQEERA